MIGTIIQRKMIMDELAKTKDLEEIQIASRFPSECKDCPDKGNKGNYCPYHSTENKTIECLFYGR